MDAFQGIPQYQSPAIHVDCNGLKEPLLARGRIIPMQRKLANCNCVVCGKPMLLSNGLLVCLTSGCKVGAIPMQLDLDQVRYAGGQHGRK